MNYTVERIEPRLFNGTVADEIIASLNDAIAERGRASLVLAGGSTPSAIYRLLAVPPRVGELDWAKVWIYWGDERFVPHTDGRSNFKMVHETLLSQLGDATPKVFAVDTSLPNGSTAAKAYSEVISREEKLAPGSTPVFDLVLLGVGEDGHTASLFPNSPLLDHKGGIAQSAESPDGSLERVTLTADALFSARRVAFLVKGNGKSEIIREVLEGSGDVRSCPANLFRSAKGHVTWFIDSEAAQKLPPVR